MMLRTVSEMMTLREICRRRCGVGVGARNNLSCPISGRKPVSVRYTFYTACLSLTNNIFGIWVGEDSKILFITSILVILIFIILVALSAFFSTVNNPFQCILVNGSCESTMY